MPLIDQELVIPFSILPGEDVCQVLTIIGDAYEELNETFRVTFGPHPTLNPEDIIIGPTSVTVTIVDNGDGTYSTILNLMNLAMYLNRASSLSQHTHFC